MVLFHDVLAGGDPDADERGQLVAHHAPAERREILDVADEQPAGNVCGLPDCLLGDGGAKLVRNFLRLPKREGHVADSDLVHVAKPNGLMDAALIQEGAVAAPQIDEPELADVLEIDDGMAPRGLGRVEDDSALRRAAYRAVATKWDPLATGRFQRGACFIQIHPSVLVEVPKKESFTFASWHGPLHCKQSDANASKLSVAPVCPAYLRYRPGRHTRGSRARHGGCGKEILSDRPGTRDPCRLPRLSCGRRNYFPSGPGQWQGGLEQAPRKWSRPSLGSDLRGHGPERGFRIRHRAAEMASEQDGRDMFRLRPFRFHLEETKGRHMESGARLRHREYQVGRQTSFATGDTKGARARNVAIVAASSGCVRCHSEIRFHQGIPAVWRR